MEGGGSRFRLFVKKDELIIFFLKIEKCKMKINLSTIVIGQFDSLLVCQPFKACWYPNLFNINVLLPDPGVSGVRSMDPGVSN